MTGTKVAGIAKDYGAWAAVVAVIALMVQGQINAKSATIPVDSVSTSLLNAHLVNITDRLDSLAQGQDKIEAGQEKIRDKLNPINAAITGLKIRVGALEQVSGRGSGP